MRRGRDLVSGPAVAALFLLAPSLSIADPLDVAVGKAVFDRLWVQAPGSTASADGLGPLYAARACASCHRGGGRTGFRLGRVDPAGHPGLVLRLGDADGRPDPVYGRQLQPEGLGGVPGEGRAQVEPGARSEAPRWSVAGWAYGAPAPDTRISPRVAPALDGIGLLARVPEAEILSRADEGDRDRDGVSGRPARLASGEIGRFGWKASEPTLEAQAASAFLLDLGLSSVARPEPAGDCTEAQAACRAAPHGAAPGEPEVAPKLTAALLAFLHRRPPPPATKSDRGERLFAAAGCAACHAPSLRLEGGGEARAYTDLLLHDMGSRLADGVREGAAAGSDWRTAPLWGLSRALAQGAGLMHDGRAASVEDAISWHGGEADRARSAFDAMPAADRAALARFVAGL